MSLARILIASAVSPVSLHGFITAAHAQGKTSFEIYGFAQADAIYDTKRVEPLWDDAFRPSKIPTTEGTFGGNGQTGISVKHLGSTHRQ